MPSLLTAGLLALATRSPAAHSVQEPLYALIPPRNLSGQAAAPAALIGGLRERLERRGAAFVPEREVDGVLRGRRMRYTDSIAARDLHAIGAATQADFSLVATIFEYVPGSAPRLSFSLRALDNASGARALSSVVALRGQDFEGWLGLGRIEDIDTLVDEALDRALEHFDSRGAPLAPPQRSRRASPRPPRGGQGFVREDFDPRTLDRVAILPLDNRSSSVDAAVQLGEFLADAWCREAVHVSEIADVRSTLIAQRVRSMQFVDLERLAEVGRGLGVRYFLMGSIENYGQEVLVGDQRFPEVEALVQLVDVEQRRIVAAAGVRRCGSEYRGLLGLGAVRDPTALGIRVARELVAAIGG